MSQVPISSIVNVQISRETQGVTQAGFGIPLILTDEDSGWGGSEFARSYITIDEVLEDFASSTDAYKAAAAILAQNPKVEELKIGKEGTRVAQVKTIVFSADIIVGNTISVFTISSGGKIENITSTAFDTNNATTLTALAAKIQATAAITTAVSNGTHTITITAAKAGVSFTISAITVTGGASQATAAIATTVENVGPAEFLADIKEADDDWYGLIWANERDEDLVYECAVYIETQFKIFGTASQDADILDAADTDDIGYILSQGNFDRTFVIYNADASDFADAAWMGKCFTFDPGQETWKFKTLNTITPDNLTSSERSAAQDKSVNIYITVGGVDITSEGVMAGGEFIDVIRGTDWLRARIEETVFGKLANRPKIPYTNDGISMIKGLIRAQLENAIRAGVIANDPLPDNGPDDERRYRVDAPLVSEISANDRAERFLPDVTFVARLAGAIHRITINGTVTV